MTLKKREQYAKAFLTAVELVNMQSGHVVTMHDHGVDAKGEAVNGRLGIFAKCAMVDADGDPLFVFGENDGRGGYQFNGWPSHVLTFDRSAKIGVSRFCRTVNDPSRDPQYKTLGDKAKAKREEHEQKRALDAADRAAGRAPTMIMPPELAGIIKGLAERQAVQTEKDARRGVASVRT